jgi:hypothetical protein
LRIPGFPELKRLTKDMDQERAWRIAQIRSDLGKLGLSTYEELMLLDRTLREEGLIHSSDEDSDDRPEAGPSGYKSSDESSVGSRRDYIPDSSDDEDDDEPSSPKGKGKQLPRDEDCPQTVPPEVAVGYTNKPELIRYSIQELVSLIPEDGYHRCKEHLGLERTVRRFDPELTNSQFKRMYIRKYKSTKGLKYLPRYTTIISGRPVFLLVGKKKYPLKDKKPPYEGKPIRPRNVRKYKAKNSFGNVVEIYGNVHTAPILGRKPVYAGRSSAKPKKRVARLSKYSADVHHIDILGGKVLTTKAPFERHKKYWYFKRRNGAWHVSEHHPYGDENEVYDLRWFTPGNLGD